jgi:inhibitor of KinA
MAEKVKIFSLGDDALTIELGDEISESLNLKAIELGQFFEQNGFDGLIETVPAYASLSIFYRASVVRRKYPRFPTAFAAVRSFAENALKNPGAASGRKPRVVEIPIRFDREYAPDLDFVAKSNNLSAAETIEIFTAGTYRVYMLGFLPGFAYMGEIDERISAPRRPTPRLEVAAGSVGIAGRQTGIYPLASPGGWQIIGRTETRLFTPEAENPCLLQPGDEVGFYQI